MHICLNGIGCPLWTEGRPSVKRGSASEAFSSLRFLFLGLGRRFLLGERTNVVDHVPRLFGVHASFFTRHLAFAFADDLKEFSIGEARQYIRVAPVAKVQLHVLSQLALAVTFFSMTQRTFETVPALAFSD